MIEISRYTEISNKDHTLLKNSKICELEKVRSALLKFWTRIHIFSSQVKFSKNRGVKFSTFWTPFKLKWNERKWFVFEAEAIWCWKKNSIFYVLICLSNETLFIWCNLKKYMKDVEFWLQYLREMTFNMQFWQFYLWVQLFFSKKYTLYGEY